MASKKSTDGKGKGKGKGKAASTRPAKVPAKKGVQGAEGGAAVQSEGAQSAFSFSVGGHTYTVSGLLTDPKINIESISSLPLVLAIDVKKLTQAQLDALDAYLRSVDESSAIRMIGLAASHNDDD